METALTAPVEFNALRPLLYSIAYKMTCSVEDSEDILQDVFEKWLQVGKTVDNVKAYLAKAVANTAINYLKKRQQERETYFGLWLPEPLANEDVPGEQANDEELRYSFLLLLGKLSPLERAIYLLRQSFEISYSELASCFEIKEDYCRQLHHRAKAHLHAQNRFEIDKSRQDEILTVFEEACSSGDLSLLIEQLKADIVLYSDGGGKVPAAVNNIYGKDSAAKFLEGVYRKNGLRATFRFLYLNNSPAAVVFINGVPDTIALLELDGGRIAAMYFVRNPEKIKHLQKFL